MEQKNPFAGLNKTKARVVGNAAEPTGTSSHLVEVGAPSLVVRVPAKTGRPSSGRVRRVSSFLSPELFTWIEEVEHTKRADGSYFGSQSEVIHRMLEIAREAIKAGDADA